MPKVNTPDGLNEKQRRFCEEYIIDFNATQAAIRAGYSAKTAYAIGGQLLKKLEVQRHLSGALKSEAEQRGFSRSEALDRMFRLARFDIRDVLAFGQEDVTELDKDGVAITTKRNVVRFKESAELSDEAAYAITGVEIAKDGALKIKTADKLGALNTLFRHMNLVDESAKGATLIEQGGRPVEELTDREKARRIAALLAKGAAPDGGQAR